MSYKINIKLKMFDVRSQNIRMNHQWPNVFSYNGLEKKKNKCFLINYLIQFEAISCFQQFIQTGTVSNIELFRFKINKDIWFHLYLTLIHLFNRLKSAVLFHLFPSHFFSLLHIYYPTYTRHTWFTIFKSGWIYKD